MWNRTEILQSFTVQVGFVINSLHRHVVGSDMINNTPFYWATSQGSYSCACGSFHQFLKESVIHHSLTLQEQLSVILKNADITHQLFCNWANQNILALHVSNDGFIENQQLRKCLNISSVALIFHLSPEITQNSHSLIQWFIMFTNC